MRRASLAAGEVSVSELQQALELIARGSDEILKRDELEARGAA